MLVGVEGKEAAAERLAKKKRVETTFSFQHPQAWGEVRQARTSLLFAPGPNLRF